MRLRVSGAEVTVGRIATSVIPRAPNATAIMSRFHSAVNRSEACCRTQPPQVPK
jgi:hypothetical protein